MLIHLFYLTEAIGKTRVRSFEPFHRGKQRLRKLKGLAQDHLAWQCEGTGESLTSVCPVGLDPSHPPEVSQGVPMGGQGWGHCPLPSLCGKGQVEGCPTTLPNPLCSALAGALSCAQALLQAPWRPLWGLRLALFTHPHPRVQAVGKVIFLQPAGFEYGNNL